MRQAKCETTQSGRGLLYWMGSSTIGFEHLDYRILQMKPAMLQSSIKAKRINLMCRKTVPSALILYLILVGGVAHAANYYVDSEDGSDDRTGLTADSAWQSLARVNRTQFSAGDSIFLKSGQRFEGTLKPRGKGTPDNPITIGKYGGKIRPVIDGCGKRASVHLVNNEGWEITGLELINDGGANPD